MLQQTILLTPMHYIYLVGIIVILTVMVMKKDTPVVCIGFLFLLGVVGCGSIVGGVQTVFNGILYAAIQFMEIMATIALVSALSKCLMDLGSDYLLMMPMSRFMKKPEVTWWILAGAMFICSLFLWPSSSVALLGAIMLPIVLKTGLNPLAAAMAMNLAGHGIALGYDFVIQGAPAISAQAAGIETADLLSDGRILFIVMGIVTMCSAFLLNRKTFAVKTNKMEVQTVKGWNGEKTSRAAKIIAVVTPLAFVLDVVVMIRFKINGGSATSVVAGTAVLIMCTGAVLEFGGKSMEKVTGYLTEGFLFAIKIFAPVIVIGAFFFLGGEGISQIMGKQFESGIMNDWALWIAANTPLNKYVAAFIEMIVGALTGLDGSGFSGLPLTGSLAQTFGTAVDASVSLLASLGQITAIFVGGGTIVPWGLIPVAAVCNVNPIELARKNLIPVCVGFICTFIVACILL